jgi:predicted PurR-regulated permease PerM
MPPTRNTSALEVALKALAVVAGAILGIYLLWRVRGLVVPVVVGGLLAYICGPLVAGLERYRITRGQAIGLLLLVLASAALGLASLIRAGAPTEIEVLAR